MAQMQGEIKRNVASLVGGIAIAIVVFVLWMLVTGELGWAGTANVLAGLVVAGLTGGYVRLADL
ncbi:MAG: hypothetical protein L6R19_00210 [Alphaproteobacteria bacterium]|nr:hypothetical protein [Alphaproteobacteria bacterium]